MPVDIDIDAGIRIGIAARAGGDDDGNAARGRGFRRIDRRAAAGMHQWTPPPPAG